MTKRLPILATIVAAADLCMTHRAYALKILAPWFFLILLLPNLLFSMSSETFATDSSALWELLDSALYIVGWGSIAVLWHWRVLRDDSYSRTTVTFDRRVWFYLLRSILIGIIAVIAAIAVGIPSTLVGGGLAGNFGSPYVLFLMAAPVAIVAIAIAVRLFIALPAIALGRPEFGLRDAWNVTKGNGIRLALVTALPLIPLYLAAWILGFPYADDPSYYSFSPFPFLSKFVQQLFDFSLGLLGLTVLSISYAFFAEDKETAGLLPKP